LMRMLEQRAAKTQSFDKLVKTLGAR